MKSTLKNYSFHWEGIDQQGLRVTGVSQAANIAHVANQLKNQAITPLKIKKKFTLNQWFFPQQNKSIKTPDIIDFSRQLTTLIDAGIPLSSALQIISQGYENLELRNLVTNIKNDIESGHSLHETLAKYPKYFDALYCNLIYLGEYSGTLASMLQQIAIYQEKLFQLANKIKKAMIYPAAVITTAMIITAIMLIFVVPQFKKMFAEFGAQLPWFTQFVITLSGKLKSLLVIFALVLIASIVAWRWLKRQPKYAIKIDNILLNLPVLGSILSKSILARFARTLAITFNAGVPLADALKITANSCNNLIYTNALMRTHMQVIAGQTIATAMQQTALFPERMLQMIAIGEESGTMTLVLNKMAEYYEQQIDVAVDGLIKLLEPCLMIVLGIIIGGLVTAMYLPIFRMGSVV